MWDIYVGCKGDSIGSSQRKGCKWTSFGMLTEELVQEANEEDAGCRLDIGGWKGRRGATLGTQMKLVCIVTGLV